VQDNEPVGFKILGVVLGEIGKSFESAAVNQGNEAE
jgi:hypothetical protein